MKRFQFGSKFSREPASGRAFDGKVIREFQGSPDLGLRLARRGHGRGQQLDRLVLDTAVSVIGALLDARIKITGQIHASGGMKMSQMLTIEAF
jgi:hypothetical protein